MKQLYTVFILLVSTTIITGQQRLTAFESEGTNKDHYIQTVDGTSYLISIDQTNTLEVNRLLDLETKELLHTQSFQGIFENRDIIFINEVMVFATASEIIDYNFINNTINSAKIPEGYYVNQFPNIVNSTDNRLLIALKTCNSCPSKEIVYELGGKTYELGDRFAFFLFNDYIFDYLYNSEAQTRDYYFYNYITNTTDTVATDVEFGQTPIRKDDEVLYFDTDGKLMSFNLIDRTSIKVADIELALVGTVNGIINNNQHLALISNLREDSTIVQVYNANTLEPINTFGYNLDRNNLSPSQCQIVDGVLSCLVDNALLIQNLETGEHLIRPTRYYWFGKHTVLEDRYIINPYDTFSQTDWYQEFELIDLQDLSRTPITGQFNISSPYFTGFAKFENKYLAAFKYNDRDYQTLFNIDIQEKEALTNDDLDNSNFGLANNSSVFQVGKDIYLAGPSLYQIENNTLKEIFDLQKAQEINFAPLLIQNEKIIIVQNSPKKIFSYDGSTLTEEADLTNFQGSFFSNQVDNLLLAEDFVLIVDIFGEVFRYDRATKDITALEDHRTSTIDGVLFSYKNKIYINQREELYITDGYTKKLIMDNFEGGLASIIDSYLIFKDQLLVMSENGLVRIEEDDTITKLGSDFLPQAIYPFVTDRSTNNLLVGDRTKKIHYDGDQIYEFELKYGGDHFNKGSIDKVIFFRENDTTGVTKTFYNCNTKEYDKLPEEVQSYEVVDYFETKGEGFLLMKSGFNPSDRLYIYKTDDSFNELELVNEYLDVGWLNDATFSKYYEEGFLYSGDLIFLMNNQNEFIQLQNIRGSNYTPQVVEEKGDLYFLALDRIYGRQLYTTRLLSFRVDTDDLALEKQNIKVFPNPSSNILNFKREGSNTVKEENYKLYNFTGQLIDSGKTTGLINIQHLTAGTYLIELSDGKKISQQKFIKQ